MEITLSEALPLIEDTLLAGRVPNLYSSPGVGKSDVVRAIAKKHKLKLIDLRLAQMDPTDLNGFPVTNKDRTRSLYAPPMNIPLEDDPIPEGYNGWLLFFDELSSASLTMQGASYKIVLDRGVGDKKLHPNVAMICAGNKLTDKAVVNRPSTAMQSRLIHYNIKVDLKSWLSWAIENKIDYRIIAFIRFRPDLLHKFDPNHTDVTYPCPRTWEFLSDVIKKWQVISIEKLPLLAGTIGEGPAIEFKGFADIFESLPTEQQIINSPATINIPTEPSTLYAITGLLTKISNENNIESIMIFINRLNIEFQIIALQGILKEQGKLQEVSAVKQWITVNAAELL